MTVAYEQSGRIVTITIQRPEARNAVDAETADWLTAAMRRFDVADDADVAVLTGAPPDFCAGADLKALTRDRDAASRRVTAGLAPMGLAHLHVTKPTIAAIEGYAVAGGLELALWCDLRIAAVDAVLGVYSRRWGLPLMDGGSVLLPRILGHGRAFDLALTGRGVDGNRAEAIGLVTQAVPKGEALATALEVAATIAAHPQAAVRSDRRSIHEQWNLDLATALEHEMALALVALDSGEGAAGAAAFARE
jgi:enoyl-CoA hydratase